MPQSNLRILVVEDIAMNRELIIRFLSELGHRADTADNGRACLEMTLHNTYDIILMDLQMPGVDGIAATREIRRRETAEAAQFPVYICAITANVMRKDLDDCLAAGMDHILAKPLRMEDLGVLLQKVQIGLR